GRPGRGPPGERGGNVGTVGAAPPERGAPQHPGGGEARQIVVARGREAAAQARKPRGRESDPLGFSAEGGRPEGRRGGRRRARGPSAAPGGRSVERLLAAGGTEEAPAHRSSPLPSRKRATLLWTEATVAPRAPSSVSRSITQRLIRRARVSSPMIAPPISRSGARPLGARSDRAGWYHAPERHPRGPSRLRPGATAARPASPE